MNAGATASRDRPAFSRAQAPRGSFHCQQVHAGDLRRARQQLLGASEQQPGHFAFQVHVHEHGAGKPDPGIFHAACARLGCAPGEVLHVGDDIRTDVEGARLAGLRTAWINREGARWPRTMPPPDLEFTTLAALADWLDANPQPESMSA